MSETKSAFAERAIQSLKHIIFRFIEEHGEKFEHMLRQLISTMNFCLNRSTENSTRYVKKTNFLSILYNKPLTRYGKPKFRNGDRVRVSKNDIPFRKGYKLQFTDETFKNFAIFRKILLQKISTQKK